MRADRLVAALLVLQAKGRVTTAQLAAELEVSARTARRDLEALMLAGIPVYPQRGRGGGWTLLGGAKTDLTGFTASEARALFVTVGRSPAATPALKAAIGKLAQALPETFRLDAGRALQSVAVDDARWGGRRGSAESSAFVDALQEAVVLRRRVELGYQTPRKAPSTRRVDPFGLVVKAGVWYLVGGTDAGRRTFRLSRVSAVEVLEDTFDLPDDFDLAAEWSAITDSVERSRRPVTAVGVADGWALGPLRYLFGDALEVGEQGADERFGIRASGPSVVAVAGQLAGVGAGVVVSEPPEVRAHLALLGRQLVAEYGDGD